MKSLQTLIKLQKQRVDEQRVILAKMHDNLNNVNKLIVLHKKDMLKQQKLLNEDSSYGLTYGEYLKAAHKKSQDLEQKRRAAEQAVHIALEKLAEVFEEQKRYEIAEASRKLAARKEEEKRDTQFLDEVGSVSFARKQKGQT